MVRRIISRRAFTLVELLVVIAIIGLLVALLLPAVQAARESARKSQCSNRIKQIALALHGYHDAHRCFPMGGRSGLAALPIVCAGGQNCDYTWRPYIGPYIEEQAWYDGFDFKVCVSWYTNYKSRTMLLPSFLCPSSAGFGLVSIDDPVHGPNFGRVRTNYVVNWGNTTVGQAEIAGVKFGGAPFTFTRGVAMSEMFDGVSKTLLVSETLTPVKELEYTGPIAEVDLNEGGQGFSAWLTPNSTAADVTFRACPAVGDGGTNCVVDGGWPGPGNTTQYMAARSFHPGGVQAAMGDGSVHFFTDEVDLSVWRALSTSKGGEVTRDAF